MPPARRKRYAGGKRGYESRVSLMLPNHKLKLLVLSPELHIEDEFRNGDKREMHGPEVIVGIGRGRGNMYISLTALTAAELAASKEFFDIAHANAQATVELRDRIAQEALKNGDDSYTRVYRLVPQLIIREGEKWAYYPRIRRGFEWAAEMAGRFTTRTPIFGEDGGRISFEHSDSDEYSDIQSEDGSVS